MRLLAIVTLLVRLAAETGAFCSTARGCVGGPGTLDCDPFPEHPASSRKAKLARSAAFRLDGKLIRGSYGHMRKIGKINEDVIGATPRAAMERA
jgi:hypothetical protein